MFRVVASVFLVGLYLVFGAVYEPYRTSIQAQMAVGQLSDDILVYGIARAAATSDVPATIVGGIILVLLLVLWLPTAVRLLRRLGKAGGGTLVLLLLFAGAACAPYQQEKSEVVAPNETAFLIPLEGASQSGQARFMSEEFLNQAKVAVKRVTVPTRVLKKGVWWWDVEYIPTVQVVKVDRTPVVREWVRVPERGTSTSDESIVVESRESIDFSLGVNASASIKEEDAAKFLYFYAGKSFKDVMDQNIRGFVQSALFRQFAVLSLNEVREQKKRVFDDVQIETREFFKNSGVTIDYIGGAEGLTYRDPKVQEAINKTFTAQQDLVTANAEKAAQDVRNAREVSIAIAAATVVTTTGTADAQVLGIKGAAEARVLELQGEQLARFPGLVALTIAQKSTGQVPQSLIVSGDGSNLPFIVTVPHEAVKPKP